MEIRPTNFLVDIGCENIPILTALNKIDKLTNSQAVQDVLSTFHNSVAISALIWRGYFRDAAAN